MICLKIDIQSALDFLLSSDFAEITNMFFAGNLVYLVVLIAAMVSLAVFKNESDRGYDLFFVYTVLLLVLIIYNPVLRYFFQKIPAAGTPIYARLFVLCPFWLIIAYVTTVGSLRMKKWRFSNYIVVIAVTIILIYFGSSITGESMMNPPNNVYKINPTAIDIADAVLEETGGDPTSLWIFMPEPESGEKYINGGTIYEGIRQYTGKIHLYRWYFSDDYWNDFFVSETASIEYIRDIMDVNLQQQGIEFAAWPNNDIVSSKLGDLGYDLVAQCGEYNIYRLNGETD